MLGRIVFPLVACCLVLCACNGGPKMNTCAADGGCAGASSAAGDTAPRAGSRAGTRTQAMRVTKDAAVPPDAEQAKDAGAATPGDSELPDTPRKGSGGASAAASSMKKSKSGQAGAGGAAMKPAKQDEAGKGGASAEAGAADPGSDGDVENAACEQTCGPCQACAEDNKTCAPVAGRDDADSCSDARSCSSRGECLHISEAQADLGSTQDYAELTQSYAQVLTFSEPATIQEIRLEVSCTENDQTFPAVWLAAAPGGIPSDTIIATANVLYQPPSDSHTFALLELSKTLEEPASGPIAIVVSQSAMSCIIRLNKESPYPNGALFTQVAGLWAPAEGSMVFQVLSSQ